MDAYDQEQTDREMLERHLPDHSRCDPRSACRRDQAEEAEAGEDMAALRPGSFLGPKVPGYNTDRVDIAAGLAQARAFGYGSETDEMILTYALQRHARGEEEAAQRGALEYMRNDLTSWTAILAAALAAAERPVIALESDSEKLERRRSTGRPVYLADRAGLKPGLRVTLRSADARDFPATVGLPKPPSGLARWRAYLEAPEGQRCQVNLIHPDKSEAQCLLDRTHQKSDTDHQDEHGHYVRVLMSQSTLREVEALARYDDEQRQRAERAARPVSYHVLAGELTGYMRAIASELGVYSQFPGADPCAFMRDVAARITNELSVQWERPIVRWTES